MIVHIELIDRESKFHDLNFNVRVPRLYFELLVKHHSVSTDLTDIRDAFYDTFHDLIWSDVRSELFADDDFSEKEVLPL